MYSVIQNAIGESSLNQVRSTMGADEGLDFSDYLSGLGLLGESEMLVLSMRQNWYFDYADLRYLRILVILKKLDLIKHAESLLQSIFRVLNPEAYFIGCFTCDLSSGGNHLNSYPSHSIYHKVDNLLEPKAFHHININYFPEIIEAQGFKIVNMTEIKGLVYFTSQIK
jgi:hypothetical protein